MLALDYILDEHWNVLRYSAAEPDPVMAALQGKSILTIISDPTLRNLMDLLFKSVWHKGGPVVLGYRCDTPTLRRKCEMKVRRTTENGRSCLDVRNIVLEVESRPLLELLVDTRPTSDDFVVVCSWCKSARCEDLQWREIEQALPLLGLLDGRPLPALSHGICPDCASGLHLKILEIANC